MPSKSTLTDIDRETHLHCAKRFFNHAWALLEQEDRTAADDDEMMHAAHASRAHWGWVGDAVNLARGEWQVSRVHAVLARAEPALYHGRRCLEHCEGNSLGEFDLGFAHEAVARAHAINGDSKDAAHHVALARAAGEKIEDAEDRAYFFKELNTIPGLDPDCPR